MPTCKNCQAHFEGVYRAKYCCARCRLDFQSTLNAETGCIEWVGARQATGYGALNIRGKVVAAHRLSYELNVGPIPDGMFICHKCDNPPCVNPEHLFLGTNADNIEDMRKKGRAAWARREMPDWVKDRIRDTNAKMQRKPSDLQKAKASETMKARWASAEWREQFSKRMTGKNNPCSGPMPEEVRSRYAAHWAAMSGVKRGPMPEETKRKISAANKGKAGMVGRVVSAATKEKLRSAAQTREAQKREAGLTKRRVAEYKQCIGEGP